MRCFICKKTILPFPLNLYYFRKGKARVYENQQGKIVRVNNIYLCSKECRHNLNERAYAKEVKDE